MNRVAHAALHDVDLVLFLIEANRWTNADAHVARPLAKIDVPVYLLVNKIDLVKDKSSLLGFIDKELETEPYAELFLISASGGDGVEELEAAIFDTLPFSRPFYSEDQITDRSERFLAAEMVREKLMERLHQELPYSLTVEIDEFKRRDETVHIGAIIWVEREGQKQIVIGKGGKVLKQVGSGARRDLEALLDERVYLQLWVKVSRDWSRNEKSLKRFGYDDLNF